MRHLHQLVQHFQSCPGLVADAGDEPQGLELGGQHHLWFPLDLDLLIEDLDLSSVP